MLKRFEIENYKNFKEKLCIDFDKVGKYQFNNDCISNNLLSKMIIFGRNSTGKTNLGYAIKDIYNILFPISLRYDDDYIINADSNNNYASFSYTFQFNSYEINYKYSRLTTNRLKNESLTINKEKIFSIDFIDINKSEFDLVSFEIDNDISQNYIDILKYNSDSGDDSDNTLPFLRWIISNLALKIDSPLAQMSNYIRGMNMLSGIESFPSRFFLKNLCEHLEEKDELARFERFLNVMGVECKLDLKTLPDGNKELYFAHNKPVSFFKTASSGTITLTRLYYRLFARYKHLTFLYMDEFDAFYHYEMAEKLVKYILLEFKNIQVIFTSHNTNLLTNKLLRPDCLFILSRNGKLTALSDATQRELREGHNLEKMYISGEFEKYE